MGLGRRNPLEDRALEGLAVQNTYEFKVPVVGSSCNKYNIITDLVHKVNPEDMNPRMNPCCKRCFRAPTRSSTLFLQSSSVSHSFGHSFVDHCIKQFSSSSVIASAWLRFVEPPFDFSRLLIDKITALTLAARAGHPLTSPVSSLNVYSPSYPFLFLSQ